MISTSKFLFLPSATLFVLTLTAVSVPSVSAAAAKGRQQEEKATAPEKFDHIAKQAAAARDLGQPDEAIKLYRQALLLRPAWAEGWWYIGTLFYELDRYAEGADAFRRTISLEPKNGPAWALRGLCEFRFGEYPAALESIKQGRLLGLGDGEELKTVVRYHAAILLTRFKQFDQATEILYAIASRQPESPRLIEALGLSMLRLAWLPSEVPSDQRPLVEHAGRAAFHQAGRRLADARTEYEQLVRLYPKTPNVHYMHGVFLLLENPDDALVEFRRELEISGPHLPALLQIAFEYIKRADYAAGLPFAEQAVRLAPNSFPARNALGRILLETGDVTRAVAELETGVRMQPGNPEMHFALARAYGRIGRKEDAQNSRAAFLKLSRMRREQGENPESLNAATPAPGTASPR